MGKFEELYSLNVNEKTEKKNGLTYLSWAWAWAEFKKAYPTAEYEVVKFNGLPYAYDEKTGYMVYTKVTADGVTHEMWLPVMDGANKAMKAEPYQYTVKNPYFKYAKLGNDGVYRDKYGEEQTEFITKTCDSATMFDVNKTVMRCLTKNLAMFGLGLYIYAGEDLPEEEQPDKPISEEKALNPTDEPIVQSKEVKCPKCGKVMKPLKKANGEIAQPDDILKGCGGMCFDCYQSAKGEQK